MVGARRSSLAEGQFKGEMELLVCVRCCRQRSTHSRAFWQEDLAPTYRTPAGSDEGPGAFPGSRTKSRWVCGSIPAEGPRRGKRSGGGCSEVLGGAKSCSVYIANPFQKEAMEIDSTTTRRA
jgi:hypothetical protein